MTQVTTPTTTMRFPQILTFPLRTLARGHFLALAYAVVCVWGSVQLASFAQVSLEEFSTGIFGADAPLFPYIRWGTSAVYFLTIPLIVVGAGLPVRLIWLFDGLYFGPLMRETRRCSLRFLQVIRHAMMLPVYALAPVAAVLVVRRLILQHDMSEHIHRFILVLIVIAALLALWKMLEWLFLVLLSTFVEVEEIYALQTYRVFFNLKAAPFAFVAVLGMGGAYWLYISRLLSGSAWLLPLLGFILWYTFAALITLVLEAGEQFANARGGTFHIVPAENNAPL